MSIFNILLLKNCSGLQVEQFFYNIFIRMRMTVAPQVNAITTLTFYNLFDSLSELFYTKYYLDSSLGGNGINFTLLSSYFNA